MSIQIKKSHFPLGFFIQHGRKKNNAESHDGEAW